MRLLWDNEIDNYTLTPSTAAANFPATNLQDLRLSSQWRTTQILAQSIVIDAGVGNTITAAAAAIVSHNLTAGATIRIQGNAADAWAMPTLNEAFAWDADLMVVFFTSAAFRFWRFYFDDAANPDGYIRIGRLFLGTYLQIDNEPARNFNEEHLDSTRTQYSPTGQAYSDEGILIRQYALIFGFLSQTEKDNFQAMFASIKRAKSLILLIDENQTTELPELYCKLDNHAGYQAVSAWKYSLSVTFREIK
jgi:hypothetical protein